MVDDQEKVLLVFSCVSFVEMCCMIMMMVMRITMIMMIHDDNIQYLRERGFIL